MIDRIERERETRARRIREKSKSNQVARLCAQHHHTPMKTCTKLTTMDDPELSMGGLNTGLL